MTVTTDNQIELNGYKYKLVSPVRKLSLSQFPAKISIGDNTYDNRRILSSWSISGERGNGVEEMDEKEDAGKAWFTNCITEYKNHLLPPRLATGIDTFVDAADITVHPYTATNPDSGWTNVSYAYNNNTGNYASTSGNISPLSYSTYLIFPVQSVMVSAFQVYASNSLGGVCHIDLDIYYEDDWHDIYLGAATPSDYTSIPVSVPKVITQFRIRLYNQSTDTAMQLYLHDTKYTVNPYGNPSLKANFNNKLYIAAGNQLMKMDSDRAGFTGVQTFETDITALIPSLDSKLYIYLGNTTAYYYMDTSESISQTDVADAYYGWQYDNKLFKCNTTGTVTYCANPDTASPTWSAAGTITDIADQIERFFVARDAAGSTVSYCATNSILKVLDLDTPEWLDTEVRLPSYPGGGKGACYFNGKIYLAYGLGVIEYNPYTGYVRDIGLTERDGLPIDFNGEIVYLLGDSSEKKIFALVDSSLTTGDSYSGLYSWSEDTGWQCWWYDGTVNQAMSEAIVSSAESAYAIYWGVGSKVYYIDIPRGVKNPDKISQNYATSGIFITPWFDAGNGVALKLAKSLQLFCMQPTDTMSITTKYRVDHANTDLDTGWTTLDTIATYFDDFEWGSDGDNIDTSGGTVTWSKTVAGSGTAKITTDQAHAGTRSLELYGKYTTDISTAYFTCEAKNGVEISFWVKPQLGGVLAFYFSSATKQIYISSGLGTDWEYIEIKNIDWDAGTYDKYRNGVKTSSTMTTGTYTVNQISFVNSSVSLKYIYIDDLEVTEETFRDIKFASGAGLPFRAIQLRLDITTLGTTDHQDIKSLVLYYKKETGSGNIRAWDVNVTIEEDNQYSAKQKYEFLESAKESDTDILFSYHPNENDERYVQISSFSGTSQTGRRYDGVYSLRLIES